MPSPSATERQIARSLDQQFPGTRFYVDVVNGNDNNHGQSTSSPLASLGQAHTNMTAGKNDTVFLIGDGSTTATNRVSSTLVWSKNACNIVGVCAETFIGQRARISHATAEATNINPLMQVTANGCRFENFSLFQGIGESSQDEQLFEVTGQRNYFKNIHFGGMGNTVGGNRAGSYILKLNGGDENLFDGCTIGLDTTLRSAANASVLLRNAATRNLFRDCIFPMWTDDAAALFVDANAVTSIDRYCMFDRCHFLNVENVGSAVEAAVVALGHANQNGTLLFNACSAINTLNWAADGGLIQLANMQLAQGDTGGEFINSDAT